MGNTVAGFFERDKAFKSSLNRGLLRDTLRRADRLIVACGKAPPREEQFRPTGEPFADTLQLFHLHANECRHHIDERTAYQYQLKESDKTDYITAEARVLAALDKMRRDLDRLEGLVSDVSQAYYEAERKKGADHDRVAELKYLAEGRMRDLRTAKRVFEEMKGLSRVAKKQPRSSKSTQQISAAMEALRRAQAEEIDGGHAQTFAEAKALRLNKNAPFGLEGVEMVTLHNSEFGDQMAIIDEQKRQIQDGLDLVLGSVKNMRTKIEAIGSEIQEQDRLLIATTKNMQRQTKKIRLLRKQVEMVLKKKSPMQVAINMCFFIVFLALIGYAVYRFDLLGTNKNQ